MRKGRGEKLYGETTGSAVRQVSVATPNCEDDAIRERGERSAAGERKGCAESKNLARERDAGQYKVELSGGGKEFSTQLVT